MANEGNCFEVTWQIEEVSFLFSEGKDRWLESHEFVVANSARRTRWKMKLHVLFAQTYRPLHVFLFNVDSGSGVLSLDYVIEMLDKNGSVKKSVKYCEQNFSKGVHSPSLSVIEHNLAQDTMTFRCRMWSRVCSFSEVGCCFLRTKVDVKKTSFAFVIENFRGSINDRFCITCESSGDPHIQVIMSSDSKDVIRITITQYNLPNLFSPFKGVYYSCHLFVLDSSGNKKEFGSTEYASNAQKNLLLNLSKEEFKNNIEKYLPKNQLSLLFQFKYYTGVVSDKNETPVYGFQTSENVQSNTSSQDVKTVESDLMACRDMEATYLSFQNLKCSDGEKKPSESCSTLKNDLWLLYNEGVLCDAKLRIDAETFPVHKTVLSARSDVFKAMFVNDMKEKITDCVDITDMTSDTACKMILFMYTDNLEQPDWESILRLYVAADKYQIPSLKLMCSTFLRENLQVATCGDVLAMADLHQDADLKSNVEDFIVSHSHEVFASHEWRQFLKQNSLLAAEAMCLLYHKK